LPGYLCPGNISINATNSLNINANILSGVGTITLIANSGAGTSSFAQNATTTVSAYNTSSTSATAVSITVNTAAGGSGNANIRTVNAPTGTLNISTFAGSILYAGTDVLTTSQRPRRPSWQDLPQFWARFLRRRSCSRGTLNAKAYVLSTASAEAARSEPQRDRSSVTQCRRYDLAYGRECGRTS